MNRPVGGHAQLPNTNPAMYYYYDSESLREQGGWNIVQILMQEGWR
jgi:hypothetical protein